MGKITTSLGDIPKARTNTGSYGNGDQYFNPEWSNNGPEVVNPTTTFDSYAEPNQDDISPSDAPFVISVNGTTAESPQGGTLQSNSFNIRVQGGGLKFYKSLPKTVETKTTRVTVGADSSRTWRIYTQWDVSRDLGETFWGLVSNFKIVVEPADDLTNFNVRYIKEGQKYVWYWPIGTVTASRKPNRNYAIQITQIHIGDIIVGGDEGDTNDKNGNDTRSGLREFAICINGKPYTCDIEVYNITAVT